MLFSVVEYTQNKSLVAVVKNIRTVAVEINNINGLRDFTKTQNMHNYASRYKLDISCKISKALIYKGKHIFLNKF